MSIRYKLFCIFSVVIALACGLAFFGIRGITTSGDLVVQLYDRPLMGINHARAAHASLNQARLLMHQGLVLGEGAPKDIVAKFEKILAEILEDLKVVQDRSGNDDVISARERAEKHIRDWSAAGLKILKPQSGGVTELPVTYNVLQKGEAAVAAVDELVELVAAYGFDYRTKAEATVIATRTTMWGLAIGTVAIGFIFAVAFAYSMSRPIFVAMNVAERVAGGNFTDQITVRRRDELGRLLTSLAAMQTSLKARADEDLALMASKDQTHAEQVSRRRRTESEIEGFRASITSILTNADAMTAELTETARTLSGIAQAAGQQSVETSSAAEETSSNVQTVAAAAGQLGTSVQAITSQLTDATAIVQRASGMATEANRTIGALANAAQRIDEVVALIRTIAGQTNLLALNATIEAARAGEAGRGFAVVASEVKTLAVQTAKATEDISSQIAEVQAATKQAVETVGAISGIMGEINGFTSNVASAVAQQNMAASEISNNIRQAAAGSDDVARSVAGTATAIAETSRSADAVLTTANDLSRQAAELRSSVDRFLANVAA